MITVLVVEDENHEFMMRTFVHDGTEADVVKMLKKRKYSGRNTAQWLAHMPMEDLQKAFGKPILSATPTNGAQYLDSAKEGEKTKSTNTFRYYRSSKNYKDEWVKRTYKW
jgi:hypothetical protein